MRRASHLAAEVEEGNNEYKLKLTSLSDETFRHRVTQLNWRLNEGNGVAVYHLGIMDNGFPKGLTEADLEESLGNLRRMGDACGCTMAVCELCMGEIGLTAEVVFRRAERLHVNPVHVQIAMAGDVDAGKSTLIAVLRSGTLDNGRGLARSQIVKHNHEFESGRTSSLSQHILYYSANGTVLNSDLFEGDTAAADVAPAPAPATGRTHSSSRLRSRSDLELSDEACRTVSFIDLAGSSKYMKTTLHGIVGYQPDWLCLCVSASDPFPRSMTAEHLGLALALKKPLLVVVTKVDTVAAAAAGTLVANLVKLLSKPGGERVAVPIESTDQIKLLHSGSPDGVAAVPIFQVSSVTGAGLELLRAYLFQLPQHTKCWVNERAQPTEVRIVGSFVKSGKGGSSDSDAPGGGCGGCLDVTVVLSGQVLLGVLSLGDDLLVGPVGPEGAFVPVVVASLRVNNVAVKRALAGQCVTMVVAETGGSGSGSAFAACKSPRSAASLSSSKTPSRSASPEDEVKRDSNVSPPKASPAAVTSPSTPPSPPATVLGLPGQVLVSASAQPAAHWEFDAEIIIINHPGKVRVSYEPVVHVGSVVQSARLVSIRKMYRANGNSNNSSVKSGSDSEKEDVLVNGDSAVCRFRFLFSPAYIRGGECGDVAVVLREGRTRGVGKLISLVPMMA